MIDDRWAGATEILHIPGRWRSALKRIINWFIPSLHLFRSHCKHAQVVLALLDWKLLTKIIVTEARDPTLSHLYIIIASPSILQAIGQAAHNGLLFTLRKSTSVDTAGHAVAEIALEICLCFHQKREGCSKSRDPTCKWNQVDAHHGKDMDMDLAF